MVQLHTLARGETYSVEVFDADMTHGGAQAPSLRLRAALRLFGIQLISATNDT